MIKYSIAVSSGSMGNLLAFLALGVKYGDEVIVPNIGWISVINACKIIGAIPIIVDVEKNRPIINTDKIQYAFPESSGFTVLQMRRENIKVEEKYDDVLQKLNIEVPY